MAIAMFTNDKGERVAITPRSRAEGLYPYRYTVQRQAPDRGWVAILRCNDEKEAIRHAEWHSVEGSHVRVIDNLS